MAFFLCIKRSKMKSNPIYTFFDYVSYDFSMYVIFLLCIFYHVCGKYHVLKLVVSPFLCSVYFRMSRVRVFVSLDFCFVEAFSSSCVKRYGRECTCIFV